MPGNKILRSAPSSAGSILRFLTNQWRFHREWSDITEVLWTPAGMDASLRPSKPEVRGRIAASSYGMMDPSVRVP